MTASDVDQYGGHYEDGLYVPAGFEVSDIQAMVGGTYEGPSSAVAETVTNHTCNDIISAISDAERSGVGVDPEALGWLKKEGSLVQAQAGRGKNGETAQWGRPQGERGTRVEQSGARAGEGKPVHAPRVSLGGPKSDYHDHSQDYVPSAQESAPAGAAPAVPAETSAAAEAASNVVANIVAWVFSRGS